MNPKAFIYKTGMFLAAGGASAMAGSRLIRYNLGPLVIILICLAAAMVAWVIGQTICWAQLGKSFQFYFAGPLPFQFFLGCQ